MNIVEKLDLAIKLKETGTTNDGYTVMYNGKPLCKQAYMTVAEWKAFEAAMKANTVQPYAYAEYAAGDGGEMTEKNGRPPKMAAYGSSSRMIYNLSSQKPDFHYEKKLPTTVGGTANLDGFYEDDNRYLFVEAKCHEPYTAKNVRVSKSYEALYAYINEHMDGNVRVDMEPSKCGKYLNVSYFADGEKLERFDMKQMICHLLGIATAMLKGKLERKQTDFSYLLYDPTELDIDPDAKSAIDAIYERTCYECNLVDFATLYRVLLDFLRTEKRVGEATDADVDDMVLKFTFALASQKNF